MEGYNYLKQSSTSVFNSTFNNNSKFEGNMQNKKRVSNPSELF